MAVSCNYDAEGTGYDAAEPTEGTHLAINSNNSNNGTSSKSQQTTSSALTAAPMASQPPYADLPNDFKSLFTASCHCGRVQYEIAVEKPLDAKYCHCTDCQTLHGAPFQWAAIVNKFDVQFLPGVQDHLEFYKSDTQTPSKTRPDPPSKLTCRSCHSPIMDEGRRMCMLFPSLIKFPSQAALAPWQPTCHIFYEARVCDIPDGKPKWPGHKDDGEPMGEPSLDE